MNFIMLLSTVTKPPEGEVIAETVTGTASAVGAGGGILGTVSFIAYMVFIVGVMWFLVIRPQKKREKNLREMVKNIRPGDSIVTNTGFYGKVVDVTEGCFLIEFGTNKGIRIPVEKSEIAGIKEPNLTVKKYDTPAVSEEKENK